MGVREAHRRQAGQKLCLPSTRLDVFLFSHGQRKENATRRYLLAPDGPSELMVYLLIYPPFIWPNVANMPLQGKDRSNNLAPIALHETTHVHSWKTSSFPIPRLLLTHEPRDLHRSASHLFSFAVVPLCFLSPSYSPIFYQKFNTPTGGNSASVW